MGEDIDLDGALNGIGGGGDAGALNAAVGAPDTAAMGGNTAPAGDIPSPVQAPAVPTPSEFMQQVAPAAPAAPTPATKPAAEKGLLGLDMKKAKGIADAFKLSGGGGYMPRIDVPQTIGVSNVGGALNASMGRR